MEREISIQINLNHESIIGLFGSFEDENNIYLVQVPIDPHSHTACTAHTALLSMVHWDPTSCPPSYRPDNSPPGMENPTPLPSHPACAISVPSYRSWLPGETSTRRPTMGRDSTSSGPPARSSSRF